MSKKRKELQDLLTCLCLMLLAVACFLAGVYKQSTWYISLPLLLLGFGVTITGMYFGLRGNLRDEFRD